MGRELGVMEEGKEFAIGKSGSFAAMIHMDR
jgi:hypothetical protein